MRCGAPLASQSSRLKRPGSVQGMRAGGNGDDVVPEQREHLIQRLTTTRVVLDDENAAPAGRTLPVRHGA